MKKEYGNLGHTVHTINSRKNSNNKNKAARGQSSFFNNIRNVLKQNNKQQIEKDKPVAQQKNLVNST